MLQKFISLFKKAGLTSLMLLATLYLSGQSYPDMNEINKNLDQLQKNNPGIVKIHSLGKSFGKHNVKIVEIGTEIKNSDKQVPAIFILANPDGNNPLSTKASLMLADKIIDGKHFNTYTYYILPVLNPDGLMNYFNAVKYDNTRNGIPVNDDNDELTDEDDFDDLNKDGYITKMRFIHPGGEWIIDPAEPRLMKKADKSKGEKGVYKIYSEGIDNDGDGKYNEDPVGGVNPGINFPFFHNPENKVAGKWPGSEDVVYNLMRFMFSHTEIAMAFNFGETNTCLKAPQGNRKGSADFDNIKIPERFAENFGIDASKTYSMDEIIEMFQPMVPAGMKLTPGMVASFLGLGAVVNHLDEDIAFYSKLAEDYKKDLEEKKYNTDRLNPANAKDGSFELWSYFHLGLPTFSMNFFTIPKPEKKEEENKDELTMDKLEKMSSEEFIALGEEKIDAFLKANNAPPQFGAAQVIKMMEGGQMTPERMAGMMKNMGAGSGDKKDDGKPDEKEMAILEYSDNTLGGSGFAEWTKYQHPTLGEVEIGGFIPYVKTIPILDSVINDIDLQLNRILELATKAPVLKIAKLDYKHQGANIYKVELWIENLSYLSFPIEMGIRNEQPGPAVLILADQNIQILEGKKRTPVNNVKGLSTFKVEYVIKAKPGNSLEFKLKSSNAGNDEKIIKIK